jgi:hypothetical protein
MKSTRKTLNESKTPTLESIESRELETIEGGINGTPCTPNGFRSIGIGPQPSQPAPFRDVFAKYTIGPI